MNEFNFITPTLTNPDWKSFRKMLYHDLSEAFHLEEMRLIEQDPNRTVYLICNGDLAIGMIELALRNFVDGCLSSPVAYLEGVYLTPQYQRKGLSSLMLEKVKSWAKQKGCKELASDAEIDNLIAQKFHVKAGFEETYRIVEYKMKI